MPQQDDGKLRTPLQELKEVFVPIAQANANTVVRHGNATLDLVKIASVAISLFGWERNEALGVRFEHAKDAVARVFGKQRLCNSYQALMVALRACGQELLGRVLDECVRLFKKSGQWKQLGRPTFLIDGSQFAVPRTLANQQEFAAASRKSKAAYKKKADYNKAQTTQIAITMCLHLTSGLPKLWKLGGAADSERGLLLSMLKRLPRNARLIMDAYYYGYQFWTQLIDSQFTFVVRVGKNVELLTELGLEGKVNCRGNLVFYWPKQVINSGGPPIVLSLVHVEVGRKRMYLLTNEFELTEQQLACLYGKRWNIEVFFRTVKQSHARATLRSRTPDNALQELDWTILGIWLALYHAQKQIPAKSALSPVKVLRTFGSLVTDVARHCVQQLSLDDVLSKCTLADESGRKTTKAGRPYPRMKRKRKTGDPVLTPISPELAQKALAFHN